MEISSTKSAFKNYQTSLVKKNAFKNYQTDIRSGHLKKQGSIHIEIGTFPIDLGKKGYVYTPPPEGIYACNLRNRFDLPKGYIAISEQLGGNADSVKIKDKIFIHKTIMEKSVGIKNQD